MVAIGTFDGLVSGLNTTEIVDSIIQFERRPALLLEIQQAQKTNVVSTLRALQAKFLALASELSILSKRSTFESYTATVSDETYLRASISGKAGNGSYDIQVNSIARNHQVASQGYSSQSESLLGTGTFTIQQADGTAALITVDATNNSLVGIQSAINASGAGVTATIINDGSESNPHRLVLSSNKSGLSGKISITSNLTGGINLNYSTSVFDLPESVSVNAATTSVASLGATAAYTGSSNKIYTLTVAGSGSQIVGTDTITINWTDGTDSGAIVVTQADTEVELVGAGSEGLKMSFAAGTLNAGDVFEVGTFTPVLQEAANAQIAVGTTDGQGSPILISSETNEFKDTIGGLSFTAMKETKDGETITVTTELNKQKIKAAIQSFVKSYNAVNKFIDDQNSYNSETGEFGNLFADRTVQLLQASMRKNLGANIAGMSSKFNQLFSVGLRTLGAGNLSLANPSRLDDALDDNLEEVIKLFTRSAVSTNGFIEFVIATAETDAGLKYNVDITQAATKGKFVGVSITDPATTPITLTASNNRIGIKVDSVTSNELILTEKIYNTGAELAAEVQNKIDNDSKIGNRGLTVEWVDTGSGTGYLEFTASTYGSSSEVEMQTGVPSSALSALGLASGSSQAGADVEGTINGEKATGTGQILVGDKGNTRTEGLKLKITLTDSQLVNGNDGQITITDGVAARLDDLIDSFTRASDGTLDSRINSTQKQITQIAERVREFDERLSLRRESLVKKFLAMEAALGSLNSQSSFLSSQLANLNMNWKFNR